MFQSREIKAGMEEGSCCVGRIILLRALFTSLIESLGIHYSDDMTFFVVY